MGTSKARWKFWIDTGGTFTDCVAIDPEGKRQEIKVLSNGVLRGMITQQVEPKVYSFIHQWPINEDIFRGYNLNLMNESGQSVLVEEILFEESKIILKEDLGPLDYCSFEITNHEEAPVLAIRIATQTGINDEFPPMEVRLGTTKGTNALLERKGAKVTLLITQGFKDLLRIGTQQRPDLFQLGIPGPEILYAQVLEVAERIDATGNIVKPLELELLRSVINEIENDVVAVSTMHAYLNPEHELIIKKELEKQGFKYVSLSHQLSPTINFLPRTQTALVNAYLSPILENYINRIRTQLKAGQSKDFDLLLMTSSGGLQGFQHFLPKDSLLSGPAGGVVGAARLAAQYDFEEVLTLDMGGTSTDTARYNGQFDYIFDTNVGGIRMASPSISIDTVAAGGGSICDFDGKKLTVGPESAGAFPGPACYGAGGPLTITDVNLLLGKFDPKFIGIPIQLEPAQKALQVLKSKIEEVYQVSYTETELLLGYEQIANQKMAESIRRISVAKGFDTKGYKLMTYGGAGGMHAGKIAEELSMNTILAPYVSGLLSAWGIGQGDVERIHTYQINQKLVLMLNRLEALIDQLGESAVLKLVEEIGDEQHIDIKSVRCYLRFEGQESCLEIVYDQVDNLVKNFKAKYEHLFGHYPNQHSIELESIKIVVGANTIQEKPISLPEDSVEVQSIDTYVGTFAREEHPVYDWEKLPVGGLIQGPAVVLNKHSTVFVEPGWEFLVTANKDGLITRQKDAEEQIAEQKEAIELELFTNKFTAIAEEMGAQLQRTAFSINIKERLDFSCALLDRSGYLLVNAPHIPVHLGSLGICTRLVKEAIEIGPGDVILTNHPKYGGSHLPDLTMLAGVFDEEGVHIGYVINRAHHAEIGGKRPGSMPPDANNLEEEGVVIPPTYMVKAGVFQWDRIEDLMMGAKFPTRSLPENLADLNAALASLRYGEKALQELVSQVGRDKVWYYMDRIKDSARFAMKKVLEARKGKSYRAKEALDDGHEINVKISFRQKGIAFDFTGTSAVHPHNMNANVSIVYSAIMYVLRLLCNQRIPLNGGLMEIVDIKLPECFLNPSFSDDPSTCPAVVGGNTEVSQRLVDTLLKALELAASSQGTMNNFLFGNDTYGYYETIGGGVGAIEGLPGRSGVHQHMTNTKMTDPEAFELRYPVRLYRYGIRHQSGGEGKWRGGDGIVREIEFLEEVEMTFLSQHRKVAPYGMAGGEPGEVGQQYVLRTDGWREYLKGIDFTKLFPGDRLVVKTPGGGGWGRLDDGPLEWKR